MTSSAGCFFDEEFWRKRKIVEKERKKEKNGDVSAKEN